MKLSALFLLMGFLSNLLFQSSKTDIEVNTSSRYIAKGFVVIELFTSEGCSSCPPADQLIAEIQKETQNQSVYILTFHVDYWNSLGWKDVFSQVEFSKRQRTYANWLKSTSVYTPQLVINGKEEFIGSNERSLRKSISSNLAKSPTEQILINNLISTKNTLHLDFQATDAESASSLVLALVQKAAKTNVKNGENGGRILSHVQVVRQLKNISLINNKQGSASINIPSNVDLSQLELIAFLQKANGEITAATKSKL